MDLQKKLRGLNQGAGAIAIAIRTLNSQAASLNGVAGVVPAGSPHPLSYFKGCRVILSNARFSLDTLSLRATATMPYLDGDSKTPAQGHRLEASITEDWFK